MTMSAVVPAGGGGFTYSILMPPLPSDATVKSAEAYDPDNANEASVEAARPAFSNPSVA